MLKEAIEMSKLKSILKGWKNYLLPNEEIETMARLRAVKCAGCPLAVKAWYAEILEDEVKDVEGYVCNGCESEVKCPLSTKLRSKAEKCPKGHW